ncbi:MAG: hypothetical protein KA761_00365 [Gemmatimonadaceae bacterium]|nr:hypothetical protein [Gemmatimonadaceae bacterium]
MADVFVAGRSGPPPAAPRDGDREQARQRVNVLVRTGRAPHPNTLPCADCGHVWVVGERRHEYDHHLGYAAAHHYDVEAVCTSCHRRRCFDRGELTGETQRAGGLARKAARRTHCDLGHPMSYMADGGWRCRECRLQYWRNRRR